jgi:hypothetical protein
MAITSAHIIQDLLESPSLPSPQKLDPIAANFFMLAFCADMLYRHNEQKNHTAKHQEDPSEPELLRPEEHIFIPMITQEELLDDSMKVLYHFFLEKLDLETHDLLQAQEQQSLLGIFLAPLVAVQELHPSTDCSLQSPLLPEITADHAVLPSAVPEIGATLASVPVVSVTYAQMLVSTISTTAADNPLGLKVVTTHSQQVTCLSPQLDASNAKAVSQLEKHPLHSLFMHPQPISWTWFREIGSVKLFDASEHAPSDVARIWVVMRKHVWLDTTWCDADGVRTQLVLRQDGTVCQTAGAVVCDSRPGAVHPCWASKRFLS